MKKITSEIFICDNCPEWANYAAVDKNGDGYLFKDRPAIYKDRWMGGGTRKYIGKFDSANWEKSLIES